jgi:hypothetical protein
MPFFSKQPSKTMSDTSSTYSTASDATTLKGDESTKTPKWYSSKTKTSQTPKTTATDSQKKQLHHEAIATYLALR